MTRDDVIDLEKQMMEEVVKRRRLGGYSMEAEGVLRLCETTLAILQHIKDEMPRPKK